MVIYVQRVSPVLKSIQMGLPARFPVEEDFTVDTGLSAGFSLTSGTENSGENINGKHPISYLSELCQKMNWTLSFEEDGMGGPSHDPW